MSKVLSSILLGSFAVVVGTGAVMVRREPPSPLVKDPRMIAARATCEHLVEHEHRIAEQMKSVIALLEQAKSANPPNATVPLAELKKLIPPLQDTSRKALDEHYRLVETTNEYVRELRHAAPGYEKAAEAWHARADDYQNAGLKQLPLGYSADCSTLASVYRERLNQIEYQAKRLDELLPFLRETRMSLQDFRLYLDQNPDIGAIEPSERYRGYLELYAKAHANFLQILSDYLAIVRTPIPTGISPEPPVK